MNFFGFLKSSDKTNSQKLMRAWRNFESYYNFVLSNERLSK